MSGGGRPSEGWLTIGESSADRPLRTTPGRPQGSMSAPDGTMTAMTGPIEPPPVPPSRPAGGEAARRRADDSSIARRANGSSGDDGRSTMRGDARRPGQRRPGDRAGRRRRDHRGRRLPRPGDRLLVHRRARRRGDLHRPVHRAVRPRGRRVEPVVGGTGPRVGRHLPRGDDRGDRRHLAVVARRGRRPRRWRTTWTRSTARRSSPSSSCSGRSWPGGRRDERRTAVGRRKDLPEVAPASAGRGRPSADRGRRRRLVGRPARSTSCSPGCGSSTSPGRRGSPRRRDGRLAGFLVGLHQPGRPDDRLRPHDRHEPEPATRPGSAGGCTQAFIEDVAALGASADHGGHLAGQPGLGRVPHGDRVPGATTGRGPSACTARPPIPPTTGRVATGSCSCATCRSDARRPPRLARLAASPRPRGVGRTGSGAEVTDESERTAGRRHGAVRSRRTRHRAATTRAPDASADRGGGDA